jgi:tyrosyl-tRNA synthetase
MYRQNEIQDLIDRNTISQVTNKNTLITLLENDQCKFYIGIDPSNDKYHIGHLVPYIFALRLLKLGAKGVILVGGFTGKVGDPSFRNTERPILEDSIINRNTQILLSKLQYLFRDYKDQITYVNNATWLDTMKLNDFLYYSNYISANKLLKMDHIQNRLQQELPLSFKEVCYTLLQAIDFSVLYNTQQVNVQIGGNDQWINILNGMYLIEKLYHNEVIGITTTLLLTKDGKKMGKTEGGAIWADGSLDIFEFWQYWRNIDDIQLENLFLLFSFKTIQEIQYIIKSEEINQCKILLANEITQLIYGDQAIENIDNILNNNNLPIIIQKNIVIDLVSLLLYINFVPNKTEGKRKIISGAVKIDNIKVSTNIFLNTLKETFILTLGKNKKMKIQLEE